MYYINRYIFLITLLLSGFLNYNVAFTQVTGQISGVVRDKNTQELLIGVAVVVEGTDPLVGAATDVNGAFRIAAIPTGSYNIKASFLGYEPLTKFNIVVSSGNVNTLLFELSPTQQVLDEVEVTYSKSIQVATIETPLSIQNLSSEEIKSNPGGNFDISRVIQSLPGVGSSASTGAGFRNDIIIRGGAPNENVYYLDGFEIPVINHFQTQGSAGGPQGILNVSFIEDVTLSSSAFDARYDNVLSSVFQFQQKTGDANKLQGNVRLSATELAVTGEGPLSPKTTFLASARRSYLELLFMALDLPLRPNYWDFQYKVTHRFNSKTTLTAIGLGAIDDFKFVVPRNTSAEKEYILRSNPFINQWNYTTGVGLKRLVKNGFVNIALSRNMFDNALDKYEDAKVKDPERITLKSRSQEIENKARVDYNKYVKGWKYSFGAVGQYVKYNNTLFNQVRREIVDENGTVVQPGVSVDFKTDIDFFRFGLFGQVSKTLFEDKLAISVGVRSDVNSFTEDGMDPLRTISPRASVSYRIAEKWKLNGSVGRYYKTPIYTVLGFKDDQGNYVNKDSKYIRSDHYVAGVEYLPTAATRFTVEGFFKEYSDYPVSQRDGISLANQGTNFGAIGNEAVNSIGKGRAYGAEFFFQQKLTRGFFSVFSYTWVRSEFTNGNTDSFTPSAWDNRHLISALFGKKFKRGWDVGLKYRFAGGAPYTPFDLEASRVNYQALGTGVLDYGRINSQRLSSFNQLDVRVDKRWNFKQFSFGLYLDIQNALLFKSVAVPQYTFERTEDNTQFISTDTQPVRYDGSNAVPLILLDDEPSVLPSIGFIIEF